MIFSYIFYYLLEKKIDIRRCVYIWFLFKFKDIEAINLFYFRAYKIDKIFGKNIKTNKSETNSNFFLLATSNEVKMIIGGTREQMRLRGQIILAGKQLVERIA